MSSLLTKWSVVQEHAVDSEDLDANGQVAEAVILRWIAAARSVYLDQCRRVHDTCASAGLELRFQMAEPRPGGQFRRPASVIVSASTTEVFPTSFVLAFRMRAVSGDSDAVLNARCTVELHDPATGGPHAIDDTIRDELIVLEHSARHFN